MGCHNLDSEPAGLCPRGGETAIDDFSVGHNLPIPVAGRTVPGDPIRKCAFLSHDDESRRSGLILPKSSGMSVGVPSDYSLRRVPTNPVQRPARRPSVGGSVRLDNPLTRTVDAGTEQKYPVLLEYAKAPFERIKQRLRHL